MCGLTATNSSLCSARVFYSFAARLGKRVVRLLPAQSADFAYDAGIGRSPAGTDAPTVVGRWARAGFRINRIIPLICPTCQMALSKAGGRRLLCMGLFSIFGSAHQQIRKPHTVPIVPPLFRVPKTRHLTSYKQATAHALLTGAGRSLARSNPACHVWPKNKINGPSPDGLSDRPVSRAVLQARGNTWH